MSLKFKFTKMVGSGNDFVLMDNRDKKINDIFGLAKKLCNRIEGIGADGLILLENSDISDFKMRIINSDGSEAEMCGNGARCAGYFANMKNIAGKNMKFETLAGIIGAEVNNDVVKVKMIEPHSLRENINVATLHATSLQITQINTGVPHAVIFVENILKDIDVFELGKFIRFHDEFKPKGTNVNFVQVVNEHEICVRTYERGVENETLSCGSGSTASAIISALEKNCKSPVKVNTKSGEILNIYFEIQGKQIKNVFLEGKIRVVFEGEIKIK